MLFIHWKSRRGVNNSKKSLTKFFQNPKKSPKIPKKIPKSQKKVPKSQKFSRKSPKKNPKIPGKIPKSQKKSQNPEKNLKIPKKVSKSLTKFLKLFTPRFRYCQVDLSVSFLFNFENSFLDHLETFCLSVGCLPL